MNKPVAWIDKDSTISMIGGIYPKKLNEYLDSLEERIAKLESHPVELTDEEIHDLIINKTTDADMIKQALKKAQKK